MTRPPLRENAVSWALHQPRGGGSGDRRGPSAAVGIGSRREAVGARGRGWRAHFRGSLVPPPPPTRGDPANPGRSRIPLNPASCLAGEKRGQLPSKGPPESLPGRGRGTHVLRRHGRLLLSLGFQLLDTLRLGVGGHCGARAGVLAHAEAGSRDAGWLQGSSRGAGLTLRRAGGAAPGALCAPRRLRASPAARARPHGSGPRALPCHPGPTRPLRR